MNKAKVIEIDGAPMLLIYAKSHGTHPHRDIEGYTNLEMGLCVSRRYEGERMPEPGTATVAWLIGKVQEVLGATIQARPWDGESIEIESVTQPRQLAAV